MGEAADFYLITQAPDNRVGLCAELSAQSPTKPLVLVQGFCLVSGAGVQTHEPSVCFLRGRIHYQYLAEHLDGGSILPALFVETCQLHEQAQVRCP